MRSTSLVVVLALLVGAGCSNVPDPAPAASTPAAPAGANPIDSTKTTAITSPSGAWYWTGSVGAGSGAVQVLDATRYRIEFADATTLLIQADCNQGRASYTLSATGEFQPGPIGLTKMGCSRDSQDRQFVAGLARGRALRSAADTLQIELDDGSTMQFRRAP